MTLLSLKLAKLLQLPVSSVMMDIRQTVVSYAVGRGHVHAASYITHFGFGTVFLSATIAKL